MKPTITSVDDIDVHAFDHPTEPWHLAIATHARPGSGKLSLGGFRIAPKALTDEPGFDADRMAADLARGMEEKVYWSRLIRAGGPLALRDTSRIVGGKCVLVPTDDARVGMPRDRELLDWALACLRGFDERTGIHVVTGQDLGHGIMSDGATGSLQYLSRGFRGSVDADTSKPTGEGNYYLLKGMLEGCGVALDRATVGLVGVGNIGMHILERLRGHGTTVHVVETNPGRVATAERLGATVHPPSGKAAFLALPLDAVVVNANKESLDPAAIAAIVANPTVSVVCGSENLAMPDPRGAGQLHAAGKLYAPTELGGMMGYLTAVEEYLAELDGGSFDVGTVMTAARRLEVAGREAAVAARERGIPFVDAVRAVFGGA